MWGYIHFGLVGSSNSLDRSHVLRFAPSFASLKSVICSFQVVVAKLIDAITGIQKPPFLIREPLSGTNIASFNKRDDFTSKPNRKATQATHTANNPFDHEQIAIISLRSNVDNETARSPKWIALPKTIDPHPSEDLLTRANTNDLNKLPSSSTNNKSSQSLDQRRPIMHTHKNEAKTNKSVISSINRLKLSN